MGEAFHFVKRKVSETLAPIGIKLTIALRRPSLPSMSRVGKLKEGNIKITFVATEELKAELQRLAREEHRPMSNFIAARLSEVVAKAKELAKEPKK